MKRFFKLAAELGHAENRNTMTKNIHSLHPQILWNHFYQLTQIPRPSHHEEKVQEFVFNFGKSLGLETLKDKAGNIVIRKPATAGMENRKGIIIQAHLDMVPQKNSDKKHDFTKDPIETYIDGEWLTANETTLGADNGIGAAAALGVLASNDLKHGSLECLFTATEETGMTGAEGLKPDFLKGEIMLNTDSMVEGQLYISCAGGEDAHISFQYSEEAILENSEAYLLSITGLKGGHSGLEIILQRGNANIIFFRMLQEAIKKADAKLASIDGGSLRNAIPREAFGTIIVEKDKAETLRQTLEDEFKIIQHELTETEPDMVYNLTKTDLPQTVIDSENQNKLTKSILACPNGIERMSDLMPGVVETSSNLAIVKSDAQTKTIHLTSMMRSSSDASRAELGKRFEALFTLAGANVTFAGAYPGWEPNMQSPILKTMLKTYEELYGVTPEIKGIHVGLETGTIRAIYPNLDMISFGPTIQFPHSPDERVHIASVQKFWNFMVATLKNVDEK